MITIPNEFFFTQVEEEIAKGHSVRFRLKGWSMFPLLRDGIDEVILFPCDTDELKPMDVVLFRYNGRHVLHRIIEIDGDCLNLMGDGSFKAKERCAAADVVGKVRFIVRPSGKIVSVDDWRWRFPSRLWRMTGPFRSPLLRILRLLNR